MRIYLAVSNGMVVGDLVGNCDILSSYLYIKDDKNLLANIHKMRSFMLDSGVFTMINSNKKVSIERYIDEYADFVRNNKIKKYVEVDVDQIYGVLQTRKFRDRLEKRVGYESIPVWHTIRGKDSFLEDTRNYEYIALGYFLTEGISTTITEKYARAFIETAHNNNCKIHGLGFTKTTMLDRYPFDSVDSSTWANSVRYGHLCRFTGSKMIQITRPKGTRMKDYRKHGRYAFLEWKKYQDYALTNIKPISV